MQKSTRTAMLVAAAVAGSTTLAAYAEAQTPAPRPSFQFERCYGINAVGKNDCAAAGNNSCAGTARVANDPKAWVYMPVGSCTKVSGGSLTPKA